MRIPVSEGRSSQQRLFLRLSAVSRHSRVFPPRAPPIVSSHPGGGFLGEANQNGSGSGSVVMQNLKPRVEVPVNVNSDTQAYLEVYRTRARHDSAVSAEFGSINNEGKDRIGECWLVDIWERLSVRSGESLCRPFTSKLAAGSHHCTLAGLAQRVPESPSQSPWFWCTDNCVFADMVATVREGCMCCKASRRPPLQVAGSHARTGPASRESTASRQVADICGAQPDGARTRGDRHRRALGKTILPRSQAVAPHIGPE
ncbi:hypothetical protein BV25DRAFT_1842103 [Artomyces pyxidatus]|uniref:Uncharacterized protein n=1 Tax=Artomyces pyxidatus TaxID=48021 RepID=A0ACB8SKP7_9AGAM|nr:hypothetical protein BV25DRAFT_1842103 [Artomyces pyxidatus]